VVSVVSEKEAVEEPGEGEAVDEFDPLRRIGVPEKVASALKDAGYYSVDSLAGESPYVIFEKLSDLPNMTLKKAEELVRLARRHIKVRIMTLEEVEAEEAAKRRVSCGSREVDGIIGGGIATDELTGVSGPYGVGKTSLVMTAALNALQLGGSAWIIDTEGAASVKRVVEMAQANGMSPEEVKKRVFIFRSTSTAYLIAALEEAYPFIAKNNVKFIGVDTLVNPFRAEYPLREHLPVRQAKLNRCLRRLLDYAQTFHLAVVVTNQVHASPVAVSPYETRPEIINPPTGGHVFLYAVNNHIYLSRAEKGVFLATLIDSSYMPRREARYRITAKGVTDVEPKEAKAK
jgi:DNA repair protein RadA